MTDDTITGTSGDNSLVGTDDNTYFFDLDGNDTLVGGAGNDTFNGGTGNDSFDGGGGSNAVDSATTPTGSAPMPITTPPAPDLCGGGRHRPDRGQHRGCDHLAQGDYFEGYNTSGQPAKEFQGNAGADSMYANGGDFSLDGGDDTINAANADRGDTAALAAPATIPSLLQRQLRQQLDRWRRRRRVHQRYDLLSRRGDPAGGAGDDLIQHYSDEGSNSIDGGDGDDQINDTSYGDNDDGNDTILGGIGDDTINHHADNGNSSIDGGDGADQINDTSYDYGNDRNDTILGGAGDDLIFCTAVTATTMSMAATTTIP